MDDLINVAGIDAKHSNEDIICSDDTAYVKKYTTDVLNQIARGNGGIAIGTGNSVPDYVSIAGYLAMNEAIREFRNK